MNVIGEQTRKWLSVLFLVTMDLGVYLASITLAHWVRLGLNSLLQVPFHVPFHYYITIWWIPLVYLAIYVYEGLYTRRSPYWDEVGRLFRADFIGTAAIFAILTLLKISEQYSRLLLLLMWLFMSLLHPIVRLWGKRILFKMKIWREKVAVWGTGPLAVSVANALISDRHMGLDLVGFISLSPADCLPAGIAGDPRFSMLGTMDEAIRNRTVTHATQIALAIEDLNPEDTTARLNDAIRYFRHILVVPSGLKTPVLNTEPLHLFREQMMVLKIRNNLLSPVNRLIKRIFDLVLVFIMLPVLLPLGVILVILIRLESKGPAIYSQDRIGSRGRIFRLYKFRSMYLNNEEILRAHFRQHPEAEREWNQYKKIHGADPRVTRIGRLIRKTSLDELPQLFNVLKGDMSLVGPRPYLPDERDEMEAHFNLIVEARPGISGLWQVSGRSNLEFRDRLRLDEWYVSNWTLWLDVEILIKTVGVVLRRKGAY